MCKFEERAAAMHVENALAFDIGSWDVPSGACWRRRAASTNTTNPLPKRQIAFSKTPVPPTTRNRPQPVAMHSPQLSRQGLQLPIRHPGGMTQRRPAASNRAPQTPGFDAKNRCPHETQPVNHLPTLHQQRRFPSVAEQVEDACGEVTGHPIEITTFLDPWWVGWSAGWAL